MITKRPSGGYQVRIYHRSKFVVARTFARKSEAVEWERNQKSALAAGTWVAPSQSDVTLGEFVASWRDGWPPLKASTRARYDSLLDQHVLPRWRRHPLSSVSPSAVQRWASDLANEHSAASARAALGLLRRAFDAAMRDGYVARNPASMVKLPRVPRQEPRPLTHEQLWQLVRLVKAERDKTLLLVLGYGGLRWSEGVALRVGDVRDKGLSLRVREAAVQVGGQVVVGTPKDHQARTVRLPAVAAARLSDWVDGRAADELLFSARGGSYLHSQNWRRDVLTPAAASLGRSVTPHNLRDTAASLAIEAGASVASVAAMLGHEDPATTLRHYAGLFPDEGASVAAKLDAAARAQVPEIGGAA